MNHISSIWGSIRANQFKTIAAQSEQVDLSTKVKKLANIFQPKSLRINKLRGLDQASYYTDHFN